MIEHMTPKLSKVLYERIRLVRRDLGNLLFHFTRTPIDNFVSIIQSDGGIWETPASASTVLAKILSEAKLIGTSRWTYGQNCICFTEAPIQEINSIFALIEIASSKEERPRYEPYGVAVSKKWLFSKGGRPVIYDHPDALKEVPENMKYRFVPYDPEHEIDFTWEREWRIKADYIQLDPNETLVIVPTSEEAFRIVYDFANIESDYDRDGSPMGGIYHIPKWLAVSLDLFGFNS
ncbi:MAG: hypothetical protein Q8M54_03725 [Desulfobaccales bacterium]|nr:hypothetical protein [Desulfobaccales bacterium]